MMPTAASASGPTRASHARRRARSSASASPSPIAASVPRTEVDPLAPDEIEAFLEACAPWWRPYFTVAFWTGARPNELAALKRGDVDGQHRTFRIRAGRYRGHESTPKTPGSVRDVDMLP